MAVVVAFTSIDGINTDPTEIDPPAPWTVTGTSIDAGGAAVVALGYQINDGPVVSVPPTGDNWSFQLSQDDLPAPGIYLLTVYAWDANNGADSQNRQVRLPNVPLSPVGIGIGIGGLP